MSRVKSPKDAGFQSKIEVTARPDPRRRLRRWILIRDALALLCAEEVANSNNTRIQKAMRNVRFPFLITIEEFDFTFGTGLRRDLLAPYIGREFVTEGRNLICGFHKFLPVKFQKFLPGPPPAA